MGYIELCHLLVGMNGKTHLGLELVASPREDEWTWRAPVCTWRPIGEPVSLPELTLYEELVGRYRASI